MNNTRKILYVGPLWRGGTCRQRFEALKDLGHVVMGIDTNPEGAWKNPSLSVRIANKLFRMGFDLCVGFRDPAGANRRIVERVKTESFDVLWIDKGLIVRPETLAAVRRASPLTMIVGYSPDDMGSRFCQSPYFLKGLPLYDVFVTTKSFGVSELRTLGCPRVEYCGNAYDPLTHRPVRVGKAERERFGGSVGFIGAYEADRARSMYQLACAGIPVRVWGPGWKRNGFRHPDLRIHPVSLLGDDYARAICSFDINLGFLRKASRDLQTQRSIEIPACGGFMLAEYTSEHETLFREGFEAEYFRSDEELINKVRYYLSHEDLRKRIAVEGRERCLRDGYSYQERLRELLPRILAG